jgi:hypothetical protein
MDGRAQISVSRRQDRWWFALQRFSIELDGVVIGKLAGGESSTIDVDPGEHVLRVKFRLAAWSNKIAFSLGAGEAQSVRCQTDWAGYPSIHLSSP